MVGLIIIAVLGLIALFSMAVREELFRPTFSVAKTLVYFGMFAIFDKIPFKTMDMIETFGTVAFAVVAFTIALILVEHGEDHWWKPATRANRED